MGLQFDRLPRTRKRGPGQFTISCSFARARRHKPGRVKGAAEMPTATKTRERTSASSRPNPSSSRPGSVLAMLKTEHKEVKGLFDQFEKETEQSPSAGKATADKICNELIRHAEMEEKIIYPELKSQDEEIFYESTEEHHV